MPDKTLPSSSPLTRKKYTPAFKAECVRQVAAGARQTDVARAQGLSPALLGRCGPPATSRPKTKPGW
jgi:transposase